jgi:hypothetical protein
VGEGSDTKRKPSDLAADHDIVAWLKTKSPANPTAGSTTWERSVTGPLQRISNEHVAGIEAGVRNRRSALGMLKKSLTARLVAFMDALPASISTSTLSTGKGTVQKRPSG